MSDADDNVPLGQIYIHNYLHLLGIVTYYYDYAITFDDELWRVWKTPWTGASILFLINRYFAFFTNIVITVGNFATFKTTQARHSCGHYAFYRQLSLIFIQIIVAVNQFLRTYALYSRSRRVAALILSIASVLLGLSVWAVTGQKSTVSLSQGCHLASSHISAIRIAVAWEALFIYDFMIFSLTFLKSYKERYQYAGVRRNDLVALIVRDGAIYFGVMAFAQCANTLTFYFCPPTLRGVLSTFASNISVTMMSRFMLNLHRSATELRRNYTTDSSDFGSVVSTGMVFTTRFGTSAGAKTTSGAADTGTFAHHSHHPHRPPPPHPSEEEEVPPPPLPMEEFELGAIQEVDKDALV